jgi:hypothetical protein
MENMGAIKVNDILSHSGVKGMKWGVTAAKSTTSSKARVAGKVSNGYTPKNAVRGNLAKRWASTYGGAKVGNTAVAGVLLATGKFSLVKAGIVATSATAATAGTAALIGGAVAGGIVGNRIMRKYGKRRLNEVRAEQAKASKS